MSEMLGADSGQPSLHEADPPVRTIETFRERWGDCGFEEQQLSDMWSVAYSSSSNLPYHNFEHTLDTLWAAMELVDRLEADGFAVNRRVLVGAALFHDSGYHRSHGKNPKPGAKEAYSAKIFAKHASRFGYDPAEIKLGKRVIKDTGHLRKPKKPESKVLVRADLNKIGGDYETDLLENTNRLYEESKLLGSQASFKKYVRVSVRILTRYLSRDLSLGPTDTSLAEWQAHALDNVRHLALSEGRKLPKKLQRLLGSTALNGGAQ
jgi:hypothetical protein